MSNLWLVKRYRGGTVSNVLVSTVVERGVLYTEEYCKKCIGEYRYTQGSTLNIVLENTETHGGVL